MQYKYETIKILGKKCLVSCRNNDECLALKVVWNVNDRAVEEECLIPHGKTINLDYSDPVPKSYRASAIKTLEDWVINQKFLEKDHWRRDFNSYWPEFRGYARVPKSFKDITKVNLYQDFLETCSLTQVLRGRCPAYFTAKQCEDFKNLSVRYVEKNKNYLESKAQEFADFWKRSIGGLGDSGDDLTNMMIAIVRVKNHAAITHEDLESFYQKTLQYAKNEFLVNSSVPYWSIDYGPEWELRKFLEENELTQLSPLFPIKTNFHLNFDDRPPFDILL